MREQLIQYVNSLFAGAPDKEEVKEEILQNTLDRYDDLIAQGKAPAAAYSLAIAGIGDVSEILGVVQPTETVPDPGRRIKPEVRETPAHKKLMRAIAIALYICCVVPVIVLSTVGQEILGVCLMFVMIAAATALIIMAAGGESEKTERSAPSEPRKELNRAVDTILGLISVIVYLAISFATGAWYITWLIFPLVGAVNGIIRAFMDVRKATGSAVARIIIWFVVALLSLAILLVGLGIDLFIVRNEHFVSTGETVTNQETLNPADVQELEIDWAAGSITIVTADTDAITVTETGTFTEAYSMVCALSDGTLSIDYAKSTPYIGITSTPGKDLTVTVPADWYCDSLELDAAAVEVQVSGLRIGSVELDGAAMEFFFDGSLHTLSCDGAACEIRAVMTQAPDTIDIDGAACVMELTLPADCGFRVQMEGLACVFNSKREFTGGDGLWTSGDQHCRITADGMACEVTIH